MTAAQVIDGLAMAELDEAITILARKAYETAEHLNDVATGRQAGDWRGDAGTLAELGWVLLSLAEVHRAIHDHAEQIAI